MAVMKAINVKNSGRMEYLHTMRYVSNPEKNPMSDNRDRAEKMEMVTYVGITLPISILGGLASSILYEEEKATEE